jgi:hypothetical protein
MSKTREVREQLARRVQDGAVIKNDAGLICLVTKETETKGEGQ